MTTYVLGLADSSCNPAPEAVARAMGSVAVPAGTTVHLYSSLGRSVQVGPGHEPVLSRLTTLQPYDHTESIVNVALHTAARFADETGGAYAEFADGEVIRPGADGWPGRILLCTGTRTTCPSSPAQVREGKVHTCEGLLARRTGELHVLLCHGFEGGDSDAEWGPAGGRPAGWASPSEGPDAVAAAHRSVLNIRRAGLGASLSCLTAGPMVLVGDGHERDHVRWVRQQADFARGKVHVLSASRGSGREFDVLVTGLSGDRACGVRTALGRPGGQG